MNRLPPLSIASTWLPLHAKCREVNEPTQVGSNDGKESQEEKKGVIASSAFVCRHVRERSSSSNVETPCGIRNRKVERNRTNVKK